MSLSRFTILLIEDQSSYAEKVRVWLAHDVADGTFVLNWVDSVEAAVKWLSHGHPDAILLCLPMADIDPLETVETIRHHAATTPLFALTAPDSEIPADRVIGYGADEFLFKDIIVRYTADLLARQISNLIAKYAQLAGHDGLPDTRERARTIGVIGARGGTGATTIACTLAAELCQQTKQKTLLADLDLNAGMVSFLTGVETEYSLVDAVDSLNRLDVALWEKLVTIGSGGMDVISSPSFFGAGELNADQVHSLVEMLRSTYRWMVLDLGRMSPIALKLLDQMDDLIVVTTVGVVSLHQSRRLLAALSNSPAQETKVHIVVNHLLDHSPLSNDELSNIFGMPIYSSLPTDVEALDKASIERTLPASASNFRKQVAELARHVAGLQQLNSTLKSSSPLATLRRHFGTH